MKSMTGFGAGDVLFAGGKLTIEIRAVNHRYLDLRIRAPAQLPDLANVVDSLARERLTRGRFDVTVRLDGGALGAVVLDRERARSVFAALTELRDELAPGVDVPLSLLGAVPDLFVPALDDDDALNAALVAAFDAARAALDEMRRREGDALAADLRRRLASVRRLAGAVAERAPAMAEAYRARLTEKIARLGLEPDPTRLAQEVVLYADRADVAEELTRIEGHAAHLEGMLACDGAIGRRLDFLLQEMAREVNTIGAKSQDVAVAHAVVDLKTEIERMREQVQNVE
ncbi:MAG: YicC family protein [Labilithrix sp.]|nr:YicC family protein [Labilithrix sp.]MCW5814102.1 YicC family protein [Labilithrix sp.]